jgi:RimJ/RimL family protein N-acetyltransferase
MRLLNHNDAEMILKLLNEKNFLDNIGDKNVRNLQDARDYIDLGPLTMQRKMGFSLYCCQKKSDNQTIGLSGLIKREGVELPEVGFAFLADFCRQGYGYETAIAVIDFANVSLNIEHLQAISNVDNIASIGLLKRLGFRFLKNIQLDDMSAPVSLFEK